MGDERVRRGRMVMGKEGRRGRRVMGKGGEEVEGVEERVRRVMGGRRGGGG